MPKVPGHRSHERSCLAPARQSNNERPQIIERVALIAPPRGSETATLPGFVATPKLGRDDFSIYVRPVALAAVFMILPSMILQNHGGQNHEDEGIVLPSPTRARDDRSSQAGHSCMAYGSSIAFNFGTRRWPSSTALSSWPSWITSIHRLMAPSSISFRWLAYCGGNSPEA